MERRTCTGCQRRLPLCQMASDGKRGPKSICVPCATDERRLRNPLAPARIDPVQVRINNTFNLWHGPVSRAPLRIAA